MTAKEELREIAELILERLPDDATLSDFIEELEVEEDLQVAEREVSEGKVLTFEEFKRRTEPCISK